MTKVQVVNETTRPTLDGVVSLDWWVAEDDATSSLPLDGSDGGLWSGTFVPPPPRPIFLDEAVTPDGLTTCDLCTWAWQGHKPFTVTETNTRETAAELGWLLTLIIVSILSAAIGAVIMISVLHCKRRMKVNSNRDAAAQSGAETRRNGIHRRPPISTPTDSSDKDLNGYNARESPTSVWAWLTSKRSAAPTQLAPSTPPVENHYTHMDETYTTVGDEALYAELDRASNNSPAYQNSAYTDPDAPVSSAPSSAYYSDLSVGTTPERAYEVVGLSTSSCWEGHTQTDMLRKQPPGRLAAITETITTPSDYV